MITLLVFWLSTKYNKEVEGLYWGTVFIDICIFSIFIK